MEGDTQRADGHPGGGGQHIDEHDNTIAKDAIIMKESRKYRDHSRLSVNAKWAAMSTQDALKIT